MWRVISHDVVSCLSYCDTYFQVICGKVVSRSTEMDKELASEIVSSQDSNGFLTVEGGTMCTDDFYEGKYVRRSGCTMLDTNEVRVHTNEFRVHHTRYQ